MDDKDRKWLQDNPNPWEKVAEMLNPDDEDCLFSLTKDYICLDDKKEIEKYNNKLTKAENRIITNTPPEPWRGNPLEANLILLSLNPGYDQNINMSLARLIQSNEMVRKALAEFRKKTLLLDADSFMPQKDDLKPISCIEAEDMLSGWYWTKKLKELRDASGREESDFYKRVALIELHGYSSNCYHEWYKNQPKHLPSQIFNKKLIHHIIESRNNEVCFLVLRSWDLWSGLLGEKFVKEYKQLFKINNNPRCQYITEKNLTTDIWEEILKFV